MSDFAPAFGWLPDENKKEDQEGSIFTVRRLDKDQGGKEVEKNLVLVRWKDSDSITVVLPYVPPPEKPDLPEQPNKPTDGHQPPTQPPGGTAGEANREAEDRVEPEADKPDKVELGQGGQEPSRDNPDNLDKAELVVVNKTNKPCSIVKS